MLSGSGAVKYGNGASKLALAAGVKTHINTANIQYADVGLFAVTLVTEAGSAKTAISATVAALKSQLSSITDADVAAAKNRAAFEVLSWEHACVSSKQATIAIQSKTFASISVSKSFEIYFSDHDLPKTLYVFCIVSLSFFLLFLSM